MKALCCRVQDESNSEGFFSGSSWCYRCLCSSPNKCPGPSGKIPLETCQSQHVCRRAPKAPLSAASWAQSLKHECYTWFTLWLFRLGTNPSDANTGGMPLNFISNGPKHFFLSALACNDIQTINSCSRAKSELRQITCRGEECDCSSGGNAEQVAAKRGSEFKVVN